MRSGVIVLVVDFVVFAAPCRNYLFILLGGLKLIKVLYPYKNFSKKKIFEYIRGPDNIGNMVYLDLILNHLEVEPLYTEDLYINPVAARENCDILILPFSNMLSPSFFAAELIDILDQYDFSIVLLSIGIQAEEFEEVDSIEISADALRLLRLSINKGFVVGARGEDTSFLLSRYEIPHEVIGCPSALIDFKQRLVPPVFGDGDIFAVNTTLSGHNQQRCKDIVELFVKYPSIYFMQSESRIIADVFKINLTDVYPNGDAPGGESNYLNHIDYDYGFYCGLGVDKYSVQKAFRSRSFFDLDIDRWRSRIRCCSFSIGSRFHGNILACHEGIPSLFVRFDRRTNELIDYHNLPNVDCLSDNIFDVVRRIDYTDYYRSLPGKREVFNKFLNRNSIPSVVF